MSKEDRPSKASDAHTIDVSSLDQDSVYSRKSRNKLLDKYTDQLDSDYPTEERGTKNRPLRVVGAVSAILLTLVGSGYYWLKTSEENQQIAENQKKQIAQQKKNNLQKFNGEVQKSIEQRGDSKGNAGENKVSVETNIVESKQPELPGVPVGQWGKMESQIKNTRPATEHRKLEDESMAKLAAMEQENLNRLAMKEKEIQERQLLAKNKELNSQQELINQKSENSQVAANESAGKSPEVQEMQRILDAIKKEQQGLKMTISSLQTDIGQIRGRIEKIKAEAGEETKIVKMEKTKTEKVAEKIVVASGPKLNLKLTTDQLSFSVPFPIDNIYLGPKGRRLLTEVVGNAINSNKVYVYGYAGFTRPVEDETLALARGWNMQYWIKQGGSRAPVNVGLGTSMAGSPYGFHRVDVLLKMNQDKVQENQSVVVK